MTCSRCGRAVPDNKLDCPACVEARGRWAMLERYREFIPDIVASKSSCTLRKSAQSRTFHIKMPHHEVGWCGIVIHPAWKDRKAELWSLLEPHEICSACIEIIESMRN